MRRTRVRALTIAMLALIGSASGGAFPQEPRAPRPSPSPQPRPHGRRVPVDPREARDGRRRHCGHPLGRDDAETVRILGIDTPETRHLEHELPYAQSFGTEAEAFAKGAFAAAREGELMCASTLDPFGRTLGYVFLDGRNYSVLILGARLAEESITPFGDDGFSKEAASEPTRGDPHV